MNSLAIQSIWQAIRESERSDDLPFIDTLSRLSQPQPDRGGRDRSTADGDFVPLSTL